MILTISQTSSNTKQEYDIFGENFYCQGKLGNLHRFQKITLSNKETTLSGTHRLNKWVNYIPFRYLFGSPNLTRLFNLSQNDSSYGSIVFSRHGIYESFYVITLNCGKILHCYYTSKGSFDYISIYSADQQIALIETYLNVNNYLYTHKLYILDDYHEFSDILSFFVLYYANFNFSKRFHMSMSSVSEKSWTFSKYNNKYNPNWRKLHFPNEDFFGKINRFD